MYLENEYQVDIQVVLWLGFWQWERNRESLNKVVFDWSMPWTLSQISLNYLFLAIPLRIGFDLHHYAQFVDVYVKSMIRLLYLWYDYCVILWKNWHKNGMAGDFVKQNTKSLLVSNEWVGWGRERIPGQVRRKYFLPYSTKANFYKIPDVIKMSQLPRWNWNVYNWWIV